jgi:8-oxo-dGTP pyrophosphatase MutT (NUDIX family)
MSSRWKPSVTVAAIVEHLGRFLLVEEHTSDGLCLNNPAGHLDPGESPLQGVVREALEETARSFVPTGIVGIYLSRTQRPGSGGDTGRDTTYLRIAFRGTVGEPDPSRALDTGIVRALWMTPDEIRASVHRHRSPLLLRCVDDHLAGVNFPLSLITTDESVFAAPLK